jgi:integrase
VLSLLVGVRTEEARALRWDHVDLDGDRGRQAYGSASCGCVAIGTCAR